MAKAKIVHKANRYGWAKCEPAHGYRGSVIAGAVAFVELMKLDGYAACPNC